MVWAGAALHSIGHEPGRCGMSKPPFQGGSGGMEGFRSVEHGRQVTQVREHAVVV